MEASDTISIALLISLVSLGATIINTRATSRKRHRDEIEAENQKQLEFEKQFVSLNVKLDSLTTSFNNLVRENEKESNRTEELTKQMIHVSERIQNLFETTKDHEKRIGELEDKVK